jgi:hypothetical protein
MKALIFNHHPEHTWEIKRALEACGVDPYIATSRLAFQEGADYCTVSGEQNDLWLRGPEWYNTSELFDDTFKYSDSLDDGFDYIFTMNRDIAKRINHDPKKLFFIACVSWDLNDMNDLSKYTKITGHYMADRFRAEFVPRFVEVKGNLKKDRNMISQLIGGDNYRHTPWYEDIIRMKSKGIPVLIAGSPNQPDGIVMDWDVLPNTSMLTHYKDYGISCTCMLKALDHGIPVYMTKQQWVTQGISDIPEECFIFADDHSIEEAYNISLKADNEYIQNTFRGIKNLKSTSSWMEKIL